MDRPKWWWWWWGLAGNDLRLALGNARLGQSQAIVRVELLQNVLRFADQYRGSLVVGLGSFVFNILLGTLDHGFFEL